MSRRRVALLVLILAASGTLALVVRSRRASAGPSNILPEDYVGPSTCRDCHEEKHHLWQSHPHSRMNADPGPETVRGDFSGVRVHVPGGEAFFSTESGRYQMTLERSGKLVRRYEVTRVVGSRFMQFYIGKQVEGPEPRTSALYSQEQKLPFGYWFRLARWLPETYFDPGPDEIGADGTFTFDPFEKPSLRAWQQSCIFCHNTYPYVFRLGSLDHAGFPREDLELDQQKLLATLAKTGALKAHRENGAVQAYVELSPRNLVTLGISCESCHFGGRAHVKEESELRFGPSSALVKVSSKKQSYAPSRKNAYAVNAICNQCHCAVVPLFPNGAGTWNSREGLDQSAGACSSAIKCTDCHDPHKPAGPEAQPDAAVSEACVRCHPKLGEAQAAAQHSKHAASVSCLDCHMPRISQGLEEVVRSHRISSPSDTSMLAAAAPSACNLCHLDKSIAWTLAALERGWGRKIATSDAWTQAYGSLDASVGEAWLKSSNPFARLVATQAYARSPLGKKALPRLLESLDDPVPVNRVFASFSIERISGEKLGASFDVTAPPGERRARIAALERKLVSAPASGTR